MNSDNLYFLILTAFFPIVAFGSIFYFFDKNKEPLMSIFRAFIMGMLSVVLVLISRKLGFPQSYVSDVNIDVSLYDAFFEAAIPEETSKYILFLFGIYGMKHFDEWYDGLLYGVMLGLGFAFIENLGYFFIYYEKSGDSLLIGRNLFSMPFHALAGGLMGFYLAKAKFKHTGLVVVFYHILALVLCILIHGLNNFFILYKEASFGYISIILLIAGWFKVMKYKKKAQTLS